MIHAEIVDLSANTSLVAMDPRLPPALVSRLLRMDSTWIWLHFGLPLSWILFITHPGPIHPTHLHHHHPPYPIFPHISHHSHLTSHLPQYTLINNLRLLPIVLHLPTWTRLR